MEKNRFAVFVTTGAAVLAFTAVLPLLTGGCGGGGSIKGQIGAISGGDAQNTGSAQGAKIIYTLEKISADQIDLRSVKVDGSGDTALATGGVVVQFDALDSINKVAYVWTPDVYSFSMYDAYTVKTDGSSAMKLPISTNSVEWTVRWSADGGNIYFLRSYVVGDSGTRNIFRSNSDGSSETQITNNSWDKSYHFDMRSSGASFVYSAGSSIYNEKRIVRYDAASATETILFSTATGSARIPLISPDGNTIAFLMDCSSSSCKNLVFINSTGQILRTTVNKLYFANESAGVWSPDGAKFAVSETGSIVVYTMSTNERKTLLTADTSTFYLVTDWSDDGSKLAGVKIVTTDGSSFTGNAIVLNSDGTSMSQVTNYTSTDTIVDRALFAK